MGHMSGAATVAEAEAMQGLTWAQQHSLQMSNLSATETSAEPLIWHNIPQSDQLSTWGQVDYITLSSWEGWQFILIGKESYSGTGLPFLTTEPQLASH